jgi:WhiB family redox-sensing transcriptional regulator
VAVTTLSRPESALSSSWQDDAACRAPGVDPELFFPVGETGPAIAQIRAAKAVCARCPVISQCRNWALRIGESDGIWGGLTPTERRRARRSMAVRVVA